MTTVRKHSRKRDAILEKIRQTTSHPSAVWIFEELRKEIPDLTGRSVMTGISPSIPILFAWTAGRSSMSRPQSTRRLRSPLSATTVSTFAASS